MCSSIYELYIIYIIIYDHLYDLWKLAIPGEWLPQFTLNSKGIFSQDRPGKPLDQRQKDWVFSQDPGLVATSSASPKMCTDKNLDLLTPQKSNIDTKHGHI